MIRVVPERFVAVFNTWHCYCCVYWRGLERHLFLPGLEDIMTYVI
jgi:hypothetical protein